MDDIHMTQTTTTNNNNNKHGPQFLYLQQTSHQETN
jgi:hypothetical protein